MAGDIFRLLDYYRSDSSAVFIFDFNNETGLITNERRIKKVRGHGFEFSLNNKYVYFDYTNSQINEWRIAQCAINDIKNGYLEDMPYTSLANGNRVESGLLQMAPNGKIYFNCQLDSSIAVINNPNQQGAACNFEISSFIYPQRDDKAHRIRTHVGLPNFMLNYVISPKLELNNGCLNDTLKFKINNGFADSTHWYVNNTRITSSNDDSLIYTSSETGNIRIKAYLYYGQNVQILFDSFFIYEPQKLDLGNDTLLCLGESIRLSVATTSSYKIRWNNNDTLFSRTVSMPELVSVELANDYCQVKDSIKVNFIDCAITSSSFCLGDSSLIMLKEQNLDSAKWFLNNKDNYNTQINSLKIKFLEAGEQLIEVNVFKGGLFKTIKTQVDIVSLPSKLFADDTVVCLGYLLRPLINLDGYDYVWKGGYMSKEISINETSNYYLTVSNGPCSFSDTIKVEVEDCQCDVQFPSAFSPNNDGLNDKFRAITNCNIKKQRLFVYTIWGEKIFDSSLEGIAEWDGNYQGIHCQANTYMWLFQYTDNLKNPKYLKGVVNLVK